MESADAFMEEQKLLSEAKYRNYMSNIDKALRNFEYSSEWADLISALGKLSKAISSNTQYQVIPRRIKISKRLAQCMHPALPSGVHLKALETYYVIFSKTGPERLATELFIYSSGLFPLLGYAAMNVRPALLDIYETFFVPLGEKLRPALSGFLSGVLPGYENGLDHFERTSSLLSQVCAAVNPTHFYTVLWECVATNASVRLPAITFLLDHFNRRLSMQDQVYIMGHNRDVMMSAICACLNDSVILVQRNTLEFLLLGFPMHTVYLSEADLIKLVTNGLNTILRRDMSLNRRLYSWLLGTEVAKNSPTYDAVSLVDGNSSSTTMQEEQLQQSYFEKHSKHILIQGIICTLRFSLESQPVDLKPYRIMVSLLDKAEIGSAVLDHVLCDIVRTMSLSSSGNEEVIKSANLLFATFDPAYIWSFMTSIYEQSCKKNNANSTSKQTTQNSVETTSKFNCIVGSGDPGLVEICFLTEFLLETISLETYNETTRIYLPKVFLAICQMLTLHLQNINSEEVSASLKLCMKIVSRVQPMITSPIKLLPRQQTTAAGCSSSDEKNFRSIHSTARSTHMPGAAVNALEKSKSDSKLNQFHHDAATTINNAQLMKVDPIMRSPSSHQVEMSRNKSPKKKKAKSYSKLSELDKEICPDTGQIIEPQQSSSDLDTPLSIKKLKSKAKSPYIRIRGSPKKMRPKDIALNIEPKSLDDALLKPHAANMEAPKSAPASAAAAIETAEPAVELEEEFSFDYVDTQLSSEEEFSILEKCIRQYEVFFEVYLSRMVLQIVDIPTQSTSLANMQLNAEHDGLNVEHIFQNEQIYEDHNTERALQIEKLFDTLCVRLVSRSKQLQSLLQLSLTATAGALTDSTSDYSDTEQQRAELKQQEACLDGQTERHIQTIIDSHVSAALRNAVKLAANLLVEMSTFPNCQNNILLDKSEKSLPSWLKVLCLVATYMQQDKELQISAITTLFDLISLLKSQIEHSSSPGVTFVVMRPLLKFGHVSYLEQKTRVFQLVTSTLWNYLGERDTDPAQITALLYQLHNCLESGLVEKIIGNRMYAHCMQQQFAAASEVLCHSAAIATVPAGKSIKCYRRDRASEIQLICASPSHSVQRSTFEQLKESESKSLKKFELLWHLGRDKKPSKGFEKTLLKVLDTLSLPHYISARTFVTKWLQSSLLRGDLSRLIKPLYKILLSANSKRIGIVHLSLLRQQNAGVEGAVLSPNDAVVATALNGAEHDVYAISSEYGNIKYHMDATIMQKKRSPIRNFHKKIFGVALSSKNKTANFLTGDKNSVAGVHNMPLPVMEAANIAVQQEAPIGLIINPLDNSPDFDDELEYSEQSQQQQQQQEPKQPATADSAEEEYEPDDEHNGERDYTASETDTSSFESESENRETSVEKDDSVTTNGCNAIKRFVGDTETVTEMLSQHERTKNRKTYRLTREKVNGEAEETTTADSVSVADDYFSEKKQTQLDSEEQQSTRSNTPNLSTGGGGAAKPAQGNGKQKKKKFLTSNEKKRMSCISKTSTDSNSSYAGGLSNNTAALLPQSDDEAMLSTQQTAESNDGSSGSSSTTINVEEKRRNLSLETMKTKTSDWQLTAETLEKSKQNVQILRENVAAAAAAAAAQQKASTSSSSESRKLPNLEKLQLFHNHMLIYLGVYDSKQTLYAFQTLRNIISCDTRTFLCLSITSGFSSGTLKQLLIRQRKCISGKGFAGNITNSEFAQNYRGCMHLEVLVTICLYYARGFFYLESNDGTNELPKPDDILGNCRVQLESIELLCLICSELIDIVKGMGKGLACYIADLMMRCKLQKVILHCLNSAVNSYAHCYTGETLAEQILNFNNPQDEHLHAESFQIQLLRLLKAVIKLEYEVMLLKQDKEHNADEKQSSAASIGNISPTRLSNAHAENAVKYLPNCLISQQPMFLAAVLSALQDERLRHLHRNWTDLVTSSLNCFTFGSLTNIVISVVHQLCHNIDKIARLTLKQQCSFPPDYVVSQLEAITILCHYCLLDNTQQTTLSHLFNQAYPQTSVASQSSNTGQLLNSIVHSFLSSAAATAAHSDAHAPRNPQLLAARNAVLSHLSRIVASVAAVWDSELGQVRPVKQQLMEFLSPVSLHHGVNFLAAVAVTWQERGERQRKSNTHAQSLSIAEQYQRSSMLQACKEQLSLVTLVSSIRVMPMDSFVQTLHQVVKSPPPIHRPPAHLAIEVSALELFYFYLKSAPAPQLADSWSSLLILIRDGLSLSPPAQFALLMLLNEFVQRCPQMPFQDKKDTRDLHDITSRLVDSLSNVAGSCLEQTTWLRRNLAVKEDISPTTSDGSARDTGLVGNQQYSVQAQSVLAAILANLLDIAYGSQEKDKVVTIITTLLYNITPYLKTHTTRNVPAFYACSSLLASLSGFQYTRKAWRKDMLDLLLDIAFFQMDISCLPFWKQIMDSLMTYDNTTFRELMSRVSLTQTGSLNIFASREQEYEQRAMLLKRLAFVIFCSEFDQYHKYMPEIQEQLANSLRMLSMVPAVQSAVFLCFRVLLLRMSPDHVTSLWPIIIAEMVQVFLFMEQELKSDNDDSNQPMRFLTGIDNGLNNQGYWLHWRSVQLEASKLLELGCVLPATNLPHFQMYRWAFVGTEFDAHEDMPFMNGLGAEESIAAAASGILMPKALYVPHIRRIARLMDMKYTVHSPASAPKRGQHLSLTCQQINSLQDLYGFFSTLRVSCPNPLNYADTDKEMSSCLAEIEEVLAKDFLEKMPNSSNTPR